MSDPFDNNDGFGYGSPTDDMDSTMTMSSDGADDAAGTDNNRTFMLVAGGMGALILLSLICFAAYIFFLAPKQRESRVSQEATVAAQNTQIAAGLTGTAQALSWTSTPLPSPVPSNTPVPSPTPVVAVPSDTPTPDTAYVTATIEAALTQAALAQQTVLPTTTALPATGFADEVGLPGLMVMGLAFIIIIFLARKLRTAPGAA